MSDDEVISPQPSRAVPRKAPFGREPSYESAKVWILPLLIPAVMIALVTAIYIGSVVDPVDHISGLPVLVVNQDVGAATPSGHVDLGQSVVKALRASPGVTNRLDVQTATLAQAKAAMDRGAAYATVVIPSTFSASALLNAGLPAPTGTSPPGIPEVQLLENSRLGSLGVNLAAGVLTPAMHDISTSLGAQLKAKSTAAVTANPVLSAHLADPITLTTTTYRPLPKHTALGLSAFYVSLIAILAGFLAGTVINSSLDSALGYATTDMGPRWKMRMPLPISRRETLLAKLSVAVVAAPLLTGVILVVAIAGFGMDAPHFGILWLLLILTTLMVTCATLALLAAFGNMGQLLAMVIIIYLSLSSSGGTVPIQALPGFFRWIGAVEPLRQVLGGSRDILYFGAQWHVGLSHAVWVLGLELAFWVVFGIAITSWYDHRKLYRIPPEIMAFVRKTVAQRTASHSNEVGSGS